MRSRRLLETGDGAEGDHFAGRGARAKFQDIRRIVAKLLIELRSHPVSAAKKIEIVHIGRAEINL